MIFNMVYDQVVFKILFMDYEIDGIFVVGEFGVGFFVWV